MNFQISEIIFFKNGWNFKFTERQKHLWDILNPRAEGYPTDLYDALHL